MLDFLAKMKAAKPAWLLGAVSLVVGFCLGIIAVWLFRIDFNFGEWVTFSYWIGDSTTTSRSEVFRNIGLAIVAGLGFILAIVRVVQLGWQTKIADKQKTLTERGQVTERFHKAAQSLGDEKLVVRLGGVYALWRLIDEIPDYDRNAQQKDVTTIVDTLAAFVRACKADQSKDEKKDKNAASIAMLDGRPMLRHDVQTAVNLLGEAGASYRSIVAPRYRVDLSYANLKSGVFQDVDFSNMKMINTDLSHSCFVMAHCSGGHFFAADFTEALFRDTHFDAAELLHTNISGADFTEAIGLVQEQIDEAVCEKDSPPSLPDGFTPPPHKTPEETQ